MRLNFKLLTLNSRLWLCLHGPPGYFGGRSSSVEPVEHPFPSFISFLHVLVRHHAVALQSKTVSHHTTSFISRVSPPLSMAAAPSTRPDEPLDPPAVCCGREFRVRHALEAHERSHDACGEAGCTFASSRAVLWLHAWEAHGWPRPHSRRCAPSRSTSMSAVARRTSRTRSRRPQPPGGCPTRQR